MDKQTKKPTTKNSKILDYINSIAVKGFWDDGYGNTMDIWCSKIDGSFITSDSDSGLKDVTWMLTHGITEQVQATDPTDPKVSCIGFNPVDQKWYGWSHRAVFGFGIGSEVKKGHCGYKESDKGEWQAETLEDAKQMAIDFAKSVS